MQNAYFDETIQTLLKSPRSLFFFFFSSLANEQTDNTLKNLSLYLISE